MEKVKLTQEQADAIESVKCAKGIDEIVRLHARDDRWTGAEWEELNTLSIDKLIRALYIGYEVEPEFKAGQWIYDITDKNKTVIEVAYVTDRRVHGFWKTQHSDIDTHVAIENARHFTKEEIAKEKERRWWVKHDRNFRELKEGDIFINEYHDHPQPIEAKMRVTGVGNGIKVVCFAEDRKDA